MGKTTTLKEKRRRSFVEAKNSQEVIPTHLEKTLESKVRHGVGLIFFGPWYLRLAFSAVVALVLAGVCCFIHQVPATGEGWVDLVVVCLAYGTWLVICGPMLLASINVSLVGQVLGFLFRLYFADVAVMTYAYYRGHNNVLRRGFGLFPTLEANRPGRGLAWLGEAGYNLRLASLIACSVIAVVITAMDMWANRRLGLQ